MCNLQRQHDGLRRFVVYRLHHRLNIRYADGSWVMLDDIEALAKQPNIHRQIGGVCNPGGIAKSLDLAPWEFVRNYVAGTQCGHRPVVLGGMSIVRVSLDAMSNTKVVDALVEFLRGKFRDALLERSMLAFSANCGGRVPFLSWVLRCWRYFALG